MAEMHIDALPTVITAKVYPVQTGGNLLANVSLDINGCFAVRGVKVYQGSNGPFVSMPSRKVGDSYKDICFPTTKEFREQLVSTVLDTYQQELEQSHQQEQTPHTQGTSTPQMTM